MAIEFNCPYCTAKIRVADSAAGKRGSCPKCATKLVVPTIEIPKPDPKKTEPSNATQTPEPAAIPSAPPLDAEAAKTPLVADEQQDQQTANKRAEAALSDFDGIGQIAIEPQPTSVTKRTRKRKRGNGMVLLIPLTLAAVLVAILLVVFYQPEPELTGTLMGRTMNTATISPAVINHGDVDVSAEQFQQAVDSLKNESFVLTSALARVEFAGVDDHIEIQLDATPSAELVAVNITDERLKKFITENRLAFGKQRLTRRRSATTKLVEELAASGKRTLSDPAMIRNAVALNSFRDAFGFTIDGTSGTVLCPCVYEVDGAVWFAVPGGTSSMTIVGRDIEGVGQLFLGRYVVKITAEQEEIITSEPSADDAQDMDEDAKPDGESQPEPDAADPDESGSMDKEKM